MDKEQLITQMVDKSIEAFLMGLEIYNKPTIRYRVEGFSFLSVMRGSYFSRQQC